MDEEDERVSEFYDTQKKEWTGVVIYHQKTQGGHIFRIRNGATVLNEVRSLDYASGLNKAIKVHQQSADDA